MNYESFKVEIANHIATVSFNRPSKSNSLHAEAWVEMKRIFEEMDDNPEVRVVILAGEGKHFCAGIDLSMLMGVMQFDTDCEGRKREKIKRFIVDLQESITSIEKCSKERMVWLEIDCYFFKKSSRKSLPYIF